MSLNFEIYHIVIDIKKIITILYYIDVDIDNNKILTILY